MTNRPLKPQVPGDSPEGQTSAPEPTPPADQPLATPAPKPIQSTAPLAAAPASLPDQSQIDPESIPYGQTRMSKQGLVCSTLERKAPGTK